MYSALKSQLNLPHCAITKKIMRETKDKKRKSQMYQKQSENHDDLRPLLLYRECHGLIVLLKIVYYF